MIIPGINVRHAANVEDDVGGVAQTRGLRGVDGHVAKLLQAAQTVLELARVGEEQGLFHAHDQYVFQMLDLVGVVVDRLELVIGSFDSAL